MQDLGFEPKKVLGDLDFIIAEHGIDFALTEFSSWNEIKEFNPKLYSQIQRYRAVSNNIKGQLFEIYGNSEKEEGI